MDWPTLGPPPLQFIAHFAHCSMRNLTLAQWSLAFCSWHKCPVVHLPYLTVLTLQRSLLGPHWAMHEPSGPPSVLHSSETCTESTTVCSSSFSWSSQNLRRMLFCLLMQAVERDPRCRVLTPIWGRENGPLFTHLSVRPAPCAKSCTPLCN